MKNYVHSTVVVTTAVAVNLRKLSQMLDKGDLVGMFTTGLSATGNAPTRLFTKAKAAYEAGGLVFPFTQLQVTNALNKCTVSDGTYNDPTLVNGVPVGIRNEGPHELIARLGLQLVRVPLP